MNIRTTNRLVVVAGLAALAVASPAAAVPAPTAAASGEGSNRLVAYDDGGRQGPGRSSINGSAQVTSYDGRLVVFSTADALVPEDTNGVDDVYVRDTAAGRTRLVSVAPDGTLGDDYSHEPTISDDGTKVAFTTWATTLLDDRNGSTLDVVVKDLRTGSLERVSVRNDGTQAKRNSFSPVISGDGTAVAFQTFGRFSGKDGDRREDVYVRDLVNGRTWQASLDEDGRDIGTHLLVGDISDDGRVVTFGYNRDVWVRDQVRRRTTRLWHEANDPRAPFPMGTVGRPVVSGNGRYVAFSTMSNDVMRGERGDFHDIFRFDLRSGKVRAVVRTPRGRQGNGDSGIPSLSRNGRFVGFSSYAGNLTGGEAPGSDTFVRDMRSGTTWLASRAASGVANADSGRTAVAISGDGRTLAYESYASNLVPEDTNGQNDVVVWSR